MCEGEGCGEKTLYVNSLVTCGDSCWDKVFGKSYKTRNVLYITAAGEGGGREGEREGKRERERERRQDGERRRQEGEGGREREGGREKAGGSPCMIIRKETCYRHNNACSKHYYYTVTMAFTHNS